MSRSIAYRFLFVTLLHKWDRKDGIDVILAGDNCDTAYPSYGGAEAVAEAEAVVPPVALVVT